MKVQLGFAQELEDGIVEEIGHRSADWSLWDGGKIGGVPSWLNPRDIPTEPIYCSDDNCKTKMKFIAQLYCPLDENEDNDDGHAFHRSLYVFACPNNKYHENKQGGGCSCGGGVRVLRCQLPRLNPFYPYDTPDESESDDDEKKEKKIESVNHLSKDGWNVNLCFVCGQRAKGKCPKAQKWFCSKDCQKEFYKFVESNNNNMNNNNSLHNFPSIYKEMELVVEEEPPPISSLNGNLKNLTIEEVQEKALFQDDSTTNQKKKSTGEKEQEEETLDEDLEQEDLNKMTGGETHKGMTDPTSLAFFSRIDRETVDTDTSTSVKDQCLRYQRWPDSYCDDTSKDNDDVEEEIIYPELWISSQHQQSQEQIPDCQYCGAPRKYEFQIMPQMLNYLTRCEGGGRTTTPTSKEANKNNNNSQNEEAKQAILAACQIREKHGDENIPSEFLQKHDEALEKMKNELLGSGNNNNDGKSCSNDATTSMDWGVIAVYTCTKSCNSLCSSTTGTDTSKVTTSNAYLEEYAWRQPPLG